MNWWNSADTVSFFCTISQVVVALAGIVALVLGIRTSHLQDEQQQQNFLNIAIAKKEASKANERAASLEHETATARLELEKIKENRKPWEFSVDQKKKFNELLKQAPKGKIEISYIITDGERVSGMARYIEEAFRINSYTMGPEIGMISNPSNPTGIQVTFISDKNKERAIAYAEIFRSLGIPCTSVKRDLSRNPQDSRFLDPVSIRVFCKP